MPWAGAAAALAKVFGFGFVNGYVFNAENQSTLFTFTTGTGLMIDDLGVGLPPTKQVVTFTGQAFTFPDDALPLLALTTRHVALLPRVAGRFDRVVSTVGVTGYAQGAVLARGRGRVAAFGEAAAFTAQIGQDGSAMGMNAPNAQDNAPFVLKVMRWLASYSPQ